MLFRSASGAAICGVGQLGQAALDLFAAFFHLLKAGCRLVGMVATSISVQDRRESGHAGWRISDKEDVADHGHIKPSLIFDWLEDELATGETKR